MTIRKNLPLATAPVQMADVFNYSPVIQDNALRYLDCFILSMIKDGKTASMTKEKLQVIIDKI